VLQPTAAMIVLAVRSRRPDSVSNGGRAGCVPPAAQVFVEPTENARSTVQLLVKYANLARREGIISLDKELPTITNHSCAAP